jgi:release factor glutamine methyltransferase
VPPRETIDHLLAEARPLLAATPFGAPPREAVLLLARVLGIGEAQVLAYGEREVPAEAAARFRALIERRIGGEPVAYLFEEREFYGRSFFVDRRVLIPRPETEHLVEEALAIAPSLPSRPWLLDIGTGSGCLAVTLALEIPGARAVAVDLSPGALAVASHNARRLGASDRVLPAGADLTLGLDLSRFDLVVSNPPYVDRADAPAMSPEVCMFEPHMALFAPGSGDSVYARLLGQCAGLRPGVRILLELGFGQLETVVRHAEAAGLETVGARNDYAGIPRVLVLRHR